MYSIQIIINIVAINFVKAELDLHQLNEENTSSAEPSLKSSIGEIYNENKRRIVNSHHVTESGEDEQGNQKGKFIEDITTKDTFKNKQKGELFDLGTPAMTKMISHNVFLDTKGRSVARVLNEKNFNMVADDGRTLGEPMHNHRRRCGAGKNCNQLRRSKCRHVRPYMAMLPRPGLYRAPLYTIRNSLDLKTAPRLASFIGIESKENLPFINRNSRPFERPPIKMDEPKLDNNIVMKLMEATNSVAPSNKPVFV